VSSFVIGDEVSVVCPGLLSETRSVATVNVLPMLWHYMQWQFIVTVVTYERIYCSYLIIPHTSETKVSSLTCCIKMHTALCRHL